MKCHLCGKPIKGKIIPLSQTSTDKWDDSWGIETILEGLIVIVCLECYDKMIKW
ncbi:MAG: hypothetical protein QW161_06720 [Candidatus Bathyarchaeia archaeon]